MIDSKETIEMMRFSKNVLNCLFIMFVHFQHELTEYDEIIEECCLKAIKFSLEKSIVPIWKFLLLFFIYLKSYLGEKT